MPKGTREQHSRLFFVPAAAGLCVVAAYLGLIWIAGLYRPIGDLERMLAFLCEPPRDTAAAIIEYTARTAWGASAALVAVATVALAAVVVVVFADCDRETRRRSFILGAVLLGIAVGAMLVLKFLVGFKGFGGPLVDRMLYCAWTRGNLRRVEWVTLCLNGIAVVASLSAALASCTTLTGRMSEGRDEIQGLAQRQRYLDFLLYAGAALLTAGAIEVAALLSWTWAPFPGTAEIKILADAVKDIEDPGESLEKGLRALTPAIEEIRTVDMLKRFSRATSMVVGVGLSLLLVALYLPTAVILRRRAANVAASTLRSATEVERDTVLSAYGFGTGNVNRLLKLAASLAPVAITALTTLVDLFGKAGSGP